MDGNLLYKHGVAIGDISKWVYYRIAFYRIAGCYNRLVCQILDDKIDCQEFDNPESKIPPSWSTRSHLLNENEHNNDATFSTAFLNHHVHNSLGSRFSSQGWKPSSHNSQRTQMRNQVRMIVQNGYHDLAYFPTFLSSFSTSWNGDGNRVWMSISSWSRSILLFGLVED